MFDMFANLLQLVLLVFVTNIGGDFYPDMRSDNIPYLRESILMCKASEVQRGLEIMRKSVAPLHSTLLQHKDPNSLAPTKTLRRALIEAIAGGGVTSKEKLYDYLSKTLMATELTLNGQMCAEEALKEVVESCIENFISSKFLQITEDGVLMPSQLAVAAVASSLSPEDALAVFADLRKARQNLVLENELHLVYLVTPITADFGKIDWRYFHTLWSRLSPSMKSVGQLVGVKDAFLVRMSYLNTHNNPNNPQINRDIAIHARFFTALAFHDLVNEMSVTEAAEKYKRTRGDMQQLQQRAATYAGMVVTFCERLGWQDLRLLLSGFAERIAFGVRRDITELVQIEGIDGYRARIFHQSGITSISKLTKATPSQLQGLLRKSVPFASENSDKVKQGWLANLPDMLLSDAVEWIQSQSIAVLRDKIAEFGVIIQDHHLLHPPNNHSKPKSVQEVQSSEAVEVEAGAEAEAEAEAEETEGGDLQTEKIVLNDITNSMSKMSVSGVNDSASEFPTTAENDVNNDEEVINISSRSLVSEIEEDSYQELVFEKENVTWSAAFPSKGGKGYGKLDMGEKRLLHTSNSLLATPSPTVRKQGKWISPDGIRPKLKSPYSPKLSNIVDVTTNSAAFASFQRKLAEDLKKSFQKVGISFCIRKLSPGNDAVENKTKTNSRYYERVGSSRDGIRVGDSVVDGIFLCTSSSIVHYVHFRQSSEYERDDNFANMTTCDDVSLDEKMEVVWRLATSERCRLVVEDSIWLFRFLEATNLLHQVASKIFCVQTASWLLEQTGTMVSVKDLARTFLDPTSVWVKSFLDKSSSLKISSGCEAVVLYQLESKLNKKLAMVGLQEAFSSLEVPSRISLALMSSNGFGVDCELVVDVKKSLEKELQELEETAHKLAGRFFSMSSPAEISKVLFVEMKFPFPSKGVKKNGLPGTSKEVMEELCASTHHPLPTAIMQWRRTHNTLSTSIWPLLKHLLPVSGGAERRVHGEFDAFTATGRVTMHHPNLQLTPKELISFRGQPLSIRSLFIPSSDCTLIAADFCQLELRVLAHLSDDKTLLRLINMDKVDVFRNVAGNLAKIYPDKVSDKQRQHAKQICYGIIYGMGVSSLSKELGVPEIEATEFMNTFKQTFPEVQLWIRNVVDNCASDGVVRTLVGRRRKLPDIHSRKSERRSHAERQAVNTLVQGSAADIFKSAMIRVETALQSQTDRNTRLILQMHDEIILETPSSHVPLVSRILQSEMENCWSGREPKLNVKLKIKLKAGPSWGSMLEMDTY